MISNILLDNFGLIIVCPKNNLRDVNVTINWVSSYVKNTISIFPCENNLPESYVSSSNIGDMINCGMSHSKSEWNLILQAGVKFKSTFFQRLKLFINNEKDVIYPINTQCLNFPESSLSWFLINSITFKKVGNFPFQEDFRLSKLLWMERALKLKCNFKGVIGIKNDK